MVSLGLSWTHLKPSVLLRFERPAGPTAPVNNTTKEKGQMAENRSKSHPGRIRTHQNVYRRHQGGPTISQKHFSNHLVNIHLHQPQRARGAPSPRRTILTPDPSLRITHAGAIEISRSDSPPNLRHTPAHTFEMHTHVPCVDYRRMSA